MFGMKSSPGTKKTIVFHRTCVLRRNTVFRKRNLLGMKKPQTGAGRLRFFLSASINERRHLIMVPQISENRAVLICTQGCPN